MISVLLWGVACARDPALQLPRADATLVVVAQGMPQITDVQAVPGHSEVVVLTKGGTAWRVDPSKGTQVAWFTVDVRTDSEMGLLGLAFAPDFTKSGQFYLYTSPKGAPRSEVSRWAAAPDTLAAPKRVDTVLTFEQPYPNHNGGQIRFGADGMLYVGIGDGGSANDPHLAGQDLTTWLGTMLRIDVSTSPYTVPPDNPFVGREGARPEIWAYGLRNPWRFDLLADGRAVIGDVGQNKVEEVTIGAAGSNHGWRQWEGDRCFRPPCADDPTLVKPVFTYSHAVGTSITGGVVARSGPYTGDYVFGDFTSGRLWRLDLDTLTTTDLGKHDVMPATFGRGPSGEPLLGDYGGTLYRIDGP